MPAVRNVLIVLAIAAAVAFLPGAGGGAATVRAVLSTLILIAFVTIFARFYREHRQDLFTMNERWRLQLYGAIGVIVLALASASRLFATGPGTLLWLMAMGGCAFLLYRCWREYRAYA